MSSAYHSILAKVCFVAGVMLLTCPLAHAEDQKPALCRADAMIVFDASGSMFGNQTRIDEVRSALAQVLPNVIRLRKVGLISFGPGPWNQCNVQLNLKPTPDAAELIMKEVDS